ncbi:MAG: glycosyltransferase [Thermodesulforhabdaceae bacterium]
MLQPEEYLIPYQPSDIPEGPYLIIAPHPDDETFGMGGTIALAARRGIRVFVVIVTDGSQAGDSQTRQSEAVAATGILGVEKVICWGIADRKVEENQLLFHKKLPSIVEEVKPRTVFLPSPFEFHPDHRATTIFAWEILKEIGFTGQVWLYEITKQGEANRLIDITSTIDVKKQAIQAYTSQLKERPYEDTVLALNRARAFSLSPDVLYAEGFYALETMETPFDVLRIPKRYIEGLKNIDEYPLVSIIVRTKNRPRLLQEALESLAWQSYPKVEAVVVNDGGEDVEELVKSFEGRIYKVTYIAHETSCGRAKAANVGLKVSQGEWVGLLDDDDLMEKDALAVLLWYGRTASVVYGQVELIEPLPDGTKRTLGLFGREFSREALFLNNYIPTCGLLFRRRLAIEIGGFDESFDRLEDWDFIYRLSGRGSFLYVPHKVAVYRSFGGRAFVFRQDFSEEFPYRKKFYDKHLKLITPEDLTRGFFDFVSAQYRDFLNTSQALMELKAIFESQQREKAEIQRVLSEREAEFRRVFSEKEAEFQRVLAEKEKLFQQSASLMKAQISELQNALNAVFNSRSWKVTAPMRWTSGKARQVKRRINSSVVLVKKFFAYYKTIGLYATILKTINWFRKRIFKIQQTVYFAPLSHQEAQKILQTLSYKPLISIVMPVYDPEPSHLMAALESVANQYYENWELCIVDDCSKKPHVKKIIESFASRFPSKIRLKFREINGHIVKASNDALSIATGEFVAFLDHDDELTLDALLEVVRLINKHPDADMIYSDEDKIRPDGSYGDSFYKPDWSPELMLGEMYTGHLGVYRKELIDKVGGFREGFEGAQDWDLILRLTEVTDKIFHIPRVLYHWRMHSRSTAMDGNHKDYAAEAGKRAVEEALIRRGEEATVNQVGPGRHLIRYSLKGEPFVSIVIPTRDLSYDLDKTITSVHHKSTYKNYEIVIVDNGSVEEETFKTFEKWRKILGHQFKVRECREPFNFSRLVNLGASNSEGEILLLLNNDMELIGPTTWLQEMAAYAQRDSIGCVGAILIYPDNTIQHGGVILGISPDPRSPGVAGHAFKHLPADHPGYFDRLRIVSNWSAVTGACMMVRRNIWNEVGGFDEDLGVAFNDIDFCLKVLTKGYRHVVLPHVRLYHHESKSRGYEDTVEKQLRFRREIDTMRERWAFILDNDPYYNPQLPINREDFGL